MFFKTTWSLQTLTSDFPLKKHGFLFDSEAGTSSIFYMEKKSNDKK